MRGTIAYNSYLGSYENYGMTFHTNNENRMTITNAGNVGIGTTTPSRKLTVVNSSDGFSAGISGTTYGLRFDNGGSFAFGGSTIHGVDNTLTSSYQILGLNGSQIIFGTSYTERMRISSNTYGTLLAVGTDTPTNGGSAASWITINGTTAGSYSGGLAFAYNSAAKVYQFFDNNNFYVQNGALGVYLARDASSWSSVSDERLKNITSNIDNAVEKLMTLRTVNFSWKSDNTNKENLGLIAQDVEKVFPQVIDKTKLSIGINSNTDNNEYLGVRYQDLVPVLIAAIQELKAEIDELKSLINK